MYKYTEKGLKSKLIIHFFEAVYIKQSYTDTFKINDCVHGIVLNNMIL